MELAAAARFCGRVGTVVGCRGGRGVRRRGGGGRRKAPAPEGEEPFRTTKDPIRSRGIGSFAVVAIPRFPERGNGK